MFKYLLLFILIVSISSCKSKTNEQTIETENSLNEEEMSIEGFEFTFKSIRDRKNLLKRQDYVELYLYSKEFKDSLLIGTDLNAIEVQPSDYNAFNIPDHAVIGINGIPFENLYYATTEKNTLQVFKRLLDSKSVLNERKETTYNYKLYKTFHFKKDTILMVEEKFYED